MKSYCSLALASVFAFSTAHALTLDDIQLWAGSGTNRAAMVIQWRTPEVRNNTSVPNPVTEKSLAWGYRWNGSATAEQMFDAIMAKDQQLYSLVSDPGGFGVAVFAFGYDLNNNRLFGVRNGTNILAYSSYTNRQSDFTNGLAVVNADASDVFQPLDGADVYWGGWLGPNWELWHELGGNGGFSNAPVRGTNAYWTPDDPDMPYFGNDGQWHLADVGMSSLELKDGSWVGWSMAAGGLDFGNPDDPGTIAWGLHKQAPAIPTAAPTNISPYAVELTASRGPFGPQSLFNDPLTVLGEPTSLAVNFDPIIGNAPFHIKLVEPAYNRDIDSQKVIVTLNRMATNSSYVYGSVTVKFDHAVVDDPANPYGVDFEVFGNTFYVGSGFVSDTSDMRTYNLTGGAFAEPMLVSVSPDGTNWYTYTNGPFCDAAFPTHGYEWETNKFIATTNGWTKKRMDFTKPVNPVLDSILGAPSATMPAINAITLYAGSGGGTGFDLAESGFSSIQYLRVEGAAGFYGGEIDAFSDVRPATLNESLTIAPGNLANSTGILFFQEPGNVTNNALQIGFSETSDIALVTAARFQNQSVLTLLSNKVIETAQITVAPALTGVSLEFSADVALKVGAHYVDDGSDLDAYSWNGTNWTRLPFVFDSGSSAVVAGDVTNSITIAVIQITIPTMAIAQDGAAYEFTFVPVAGWKHTLERSTDFLSWTAIGDVTPGNTQPVTLRDENPPVDKAFYRLRLNRQ